MSNIPLNDRISQANQMLARSWNVQGQANRAMENGTFNFRAAAEQLTRITLNIGGFAIRISEYEDAEDTFLWALNDIFYGSNLSSEDHHNFLSVLEAGIA